MADKYKNGEDELKALFARFMGLFLCIFQLLVLGMKQLNLKWHLNVVRMHLQTCCTSVELCVCVLIPVYFICVFMSNTQPVTGAAAG